MSLSKAKRQGRKQEESEMCFLNNLRLVALTHASIKSLMSFPRLQVVHLIIKTSSVFAICEPDCDLLRFEDLAMTGTL